MRKLLLSFVTFCLFCSIAGLAVAGDQVVTLRVTSLDALLADAERVAAAAGEPESREELLDDATGPLGLTDDDWIDRKRPIVLSVPQAGLATMGWIGALPVKDVESALAALDQALEEEDADGMRSYATPFGQTVYVMPVQDYLIVGGNRGLVEEADLAEVLDVGDLPAGNLALDIHLEPLASMIQLGMAAARQGMGEDEDDAASAAMLDLYLELTNNVLLNTKRVQISVELASEHILLHKRLIPRTGSTLDGLLAAQKAKFPDLAKRLEPGSAVALSAGEVTYTPEFREALKQFMRSYFDAVTVMAQQHADDEADWLDAMMKPWQSSIEDWVDCVRGDIAGILDIDAEQGFRVTQLMGVTDSEKCGKLIGDVAKYVEQIPHPTEGQPLARVTEEALVHAGVHATKIEMPLPAVDAEDDEAELMSRMFGGTSYIYYLGISDDVFVSTAGAGAEEWFKLTTDRLVSGKKRGGMMPHLFEPLKTGPGFFVTIDLGRLFKELAALDPDDEDLQELGTVADVAGSVVCGTRLLKGSFDFDLAFPLRLIQAMAELEDDDESSPPSEPQEPADRS